MALPCQSLERFPVVRGDVNDLSGLELVGVDVNAELLLAGKTQAIGGLF